MNKSMLIAAAQSKIEPDIIFKNANVVNVFSGKTEHCDVAVYNGVIAGLGEYSGKNEIDLNGKYLMPSFIDAHCHIESSLVSPVEYAKLVIPKGVTAVIADPHEIANVKGEEGLSFMIKSAEGLPLDVHYMLPSCVPATPFDSSGAVIDSKLTKELMQKHGFLGLGEMMDFVSVLNSSDEVLAKIECADIIDGHAPYISGKELCAYACADIKTDHECTIPQEASEKAARGMYVQIREGTSAKNLEALLPAINEYNFDRFLFCTDDKHLDDILEEGTISHCIDKAISLGLDPVKAIRMASLNAAQCYNLPHTGAIAPGYFADIVISEDLNATKITEVYKRGVLVAKNDKALFLAPAETDGNVTDTVHINPVKTEDFKMEFNSSIPVIEVMPDTLVTKSVLRKTGEQLEMCACLERHKGTGNIGKAFVTGFGIKNGAVAQTIGHDNHNITVLGTSAEDMALAVNSLGKDGGIAVVIDGKLEAEMPLPIAGLMSDKPYEEAVKEYIAIKNAVKKLVPDSKIDTLMMLSFLSLCVIPEIRVSDKGLFSVTDMKFIE
ncbi:MAG: adenine deaminase [Clostridiales bacterium]|nr:adenine deaminase [Clostridiales bacterium]